MLADHVDCPGAVELCTIKGSHRVGAEEVGVGGEGEVQQLVPPSLAGRAQPAVVDVDESLDHPVYQPLA